MKGIRLVSYILLIWSTVSGLLIFADIKNEQPMVTAWASFFAILIIYQSIHIITQDEPRRKQTGV